jgi:biotin operon repressor
MLVAKKETWLTREDIYKMLGISKNKFLKDIEPHLTVSIISAYKKLYTLASIEQLIQKNVIKKAA